MWQKDQTILTKIGVFFLLLYSLIIQPPQTGVNLRFSVNNAPAISSDLSADDIYRYREGKMKLAEEKPISQQEVEKQENAPTVASISIPKQTPTPTPTPTTNVKSTKDVSSQYQEPKKDADFAILSNNQSEFEIIELIKSAASEYNVDPSMMIAIAKCESGFRSDAVNGQYAGIFQFHPSTWQSNRRAMGMDDSTSLRFDANEAAKTAAFKMSRDGFGAWPECGKKALLAINE